MNIGGFDGGGLVSDDIVVIQESVAYGELVLLIYFGGACELLSLDVCKEEHEIFLRTLGYLNTHSDNASLFYDNSFILVSNSLWVSV